MSVILASFEGLFSVKVISETQQDLYIEEVMAKKSTTQSGLTLPIAAMLVMAFLGAIVVGGSFEVIKYWPQPQSVEPVYNFVGGAIWGAVGGAVFGFIIGFLTDDSHFPKAEPTEVVK